MTAPTIPDDPIYQLLRQEKVDEFNNQRETSDLSHLKGCDYRGLDLRKLNADGLDLTDAYFRNSDLRGIDFRNAILEGVSICDAKISGCYFPKSLSAAELRMSLEFGTRLRCRGN